MGAPVPDGGVFRGLIAGSYELLVDAPGFAVARVDAPDLGAREFRELTVHLTRGATLRGTVTEGPESKPAGGVKVLLHELTSDDEQRKFGTPAGPADDTNGALVTTVSDKGRFEFVHLTRGEYRIEVRRSHPNPVWEAPCVVDGEATKNLDIHLPAAFELRGRLRCDRPVRLTEFVVALSRVNVNRNSTLDSARDTELAFVSELQVLEDGSFHAADLAEGTYDLLLTFPDSKVYIGSGASHVYGGHVQRIGRVKIPGESASVREFDISAYAPGRIRASVTVNGVAQPGLQVVVWIPNPFGEYRIVCARTDVNGVADVGPLLSGDWQLEVFPFSGSWVHSSGDLVEVERGLTAGLDVNISLVEGVVQYVDNATGQPIARRGVYLGTGIRSAANIGVTDVNGLLKLTQPKGSTLRFTMQPEDINDLPLRPCVMPLRWEPGGAGTMVVKIE
jgi:hypothetical protein